MVIFANKGNVAERLKGVYGDAARTLHCGVYPRPVELKKGGEHDLVVSIDKSHYFIRPSGISVPITDPALLADPTTVRADPSHAPEFGSRKVIVAPH